MAKFIYEREGLTLVEVLVASAIATIVIAGSVAFYLMAHAAWIDCSKRVPLQRKASLAMEKMVRGIDGSNGIREAKSAMAPDSSTICFRSGIDNLVRSFYLDGDEIFYDPTPPITICYDSTSSTADDEFDIVEKVTNLTFDLDTIDNAVIINLDMQDTVKVRTINVNLSTTVNMRNVP